MSVEEKLVRETVKRTGVSIPRGMGKTNTAVVMAKEEFVRNYVPVVLQHIRDHGCSGLKCKRCPLNNVCDRNAKNSKTLAAQVIAYAASENAIRGV